MRTDWLRHAWRRFHLALVLMVVLSLALTSAALAQAPQTHIIEGPFQRDAEVVLINRLDGRIVIWDPAVGSNTIDLNGKYVAWGGPYYQAAVGDFQGDGMGEIAIIGGGATVNAPGPLLHSFDPV